MKKLTFKISVLFLASMSLWSCKKNDDKTPTPPSTTTDYSTHSKVEQNFMSLQDKISSDTTDHQNGRVATCGGFSFAWITNTNPVPGFKANYAKYEITFDGSICNDGKSRTGTITWYVAPFIKDSLVYNHVIQDGNVINGYRMSKYNSTLSTGGAAYNVIVNGTITLADGNTYNYNTNEVLKYVNVWSANDGSLEVTGTSSVDNKKGAVITRSIAVNTPVIFKKSCDDYKTGVSGLVEFTNSSFPGYKTSVDLGNGTCDKDAVYTDAAGKSFKFTMD